MGLRYKYLDLNLSQLEAVIRQYLKELDEYSTGLFYYAGHGMQIDGKNYIVPIDCEIKDKTHTILSSYPYSSGEQDDRRGRAFAQVSAS